MGADNVYVSSDFRESLPVLSWIPNETTTDFLFAESLKMTFVQKGSTQTFHVTECLMKGLDLKGGIRLENDKPIALHAFMMFTKRFAEKIQEDVASRMFVGNEGRRGTS